MNKYFQGKNNILKGKSGEDIAVNFLKKSGFEIIVRNYKTEIGEIDIVAAGEGYLVFVEVKLRSGSEFGQPCECVTPAQIKRICQVASQYINSFGLYDADVRFDIIEIDGISKEVNHIPNAFDSYLRY